MAMRNTTCPYCGNKSEISDWDEVSKKPLEIEDEVFCECTKCKKPYLAILKYHVTSKAGFLYFGSIQINQGVNTTKTNIKQLEVKGV